MKHLTPSKTEILQTIPFPVTAMPNRFCIDSTGTSIHSRARYRTAMSLQTFFLLTTFVYHLVWFVGGVLFKLPLPIELYSPVNVAFVLVTMVIDIVCLMAYAIRQNSDFHNNHCYSAYFEHRIDVIAEWANNYDDADTDILRFRPVDDGSGHYHDAVRAYAFHAHLVRPSFWAHPLIWMCIKELHKACGI